MVHRVLVRERHDVTGLHSDRCWDEANLADIDSHVFADADPAQSTVTATAKKSTFFIPTPFR